MMLPSCNSSKRLRRQSWGFGVATPDFGRGGKGAKLDKNVGLNDKKCIFWEKQHFFGLGDFCDRIPQPPDFEPD